MPGLLDHYRLLQHASDRRLAAARQGRWPEVCRLEDECRTTIERLRDAASRETLSPADVRRKMDIMLNIVRTDAEVRRLAQPWLGTLDRVLSGRPGGDA
jgi:flagellar protein FliT